MLTAIMVVFLAVVVILTLVIWVCKKQTYCRSKTCLVGKTALVTGGASGIGYALVLELAARGCKVIIADKNKNDELKDNVFRETSNPNIVMKYIDLASFTSVREFAHDLKKSEVQLDILINNAGIAQKSWPHTNDGLSRILQVNYYSPFLLTHLLVDLLKKSGDARIVFTSSLIAYLHPLTTRSIQHGLEKVSQKFLYSVSKFCQITSSSMFAEKLQRFGITSNCFHPFIARTNIFETSTSNWTDWSTKIFFKIGVLLMGKTAEEAAQTCLYLACSKEVKNVTGEFFGNLQLSWKPPGANNRELREAIWKYSEEIVKLTPEEKL